MGWNNVCVIGQLTVPVAACVGEPPDGTGNGGAEGGGRRTDSPRDGAAEIRNGGSRLPSNGDSHSNNQTMPCSLRFRLCNSEAPML